MKLVFVEMNSSM